MSQTDKTQAVPLKAKPGLAIGEIDAASIIRDEPEKLVHEEQISPENHLTAIRKKTIDDVSLDYP